MEIYLIISGIIYLFSVYFAYKTIQKQYYHPHGFNYLGNNKMTKKTNLIMLLFVFCPWINTMIAFFVGWKNSKYKKELMFFKPNKPFKID